MIGEILTKYGSDKESCHGYGFLYNEIFKKLPEDLFILEIGVDKGASLKAWREYRPKSQIYAVDINPVETTENFAQVDIKTCPFHMRMFDLIVDDGSHLLSDIAFVVEKYIKNLTPNGIMVIEDVRHPEWFEGLKKTMIEHIWPNPSRLMVMMETGEKYDDRVIIIK